MFCLQKLVIYFMILVGCNTMINKTLILRIINDLCTCLIELKIPYTIIIYLSSTSSCIVLYNNKKPADILLNLRYLFSLAYHTKTYFLDLRSTIVQLCSCFMILKSNLKCMQEMSVSTIYGIKASI